MMKYPRIWCVRADDGNIGWWHPAPRRGIMRVMIIPDNTCYAPPHWLHGQGPVWANNVKLCHIVPRLSIVRPFPDSINRDENISILSNDREILWEWNYIEYEIKKRMKKKEEEVVIMSERNYLSIDEFHLSKEIIRKNSSICLSNVSWC